MAKIVMFVMMAFILMKRVGGGEVVMSLFKLLFVSALIFVIAYEFYHLPQDSKVMSVFQRLGKHSLEIYILHFFFLFNNPIDWDRVSGLFVERGGQIPISLIQMIAVSVETLFVIGLCVLLMKLMATSKTIYKLFLGRSISVE